MNRYFARRELCDRLEDKNKLIKSEREQQREKIRRQKRRRSRRQQARVLADKSCQGNKKMARRAVSLHTDD